MYELEAFLSLVVGLAYLEAIVRGRRAFAPLLVAGLALMVYTHNWALFLCVGLAVATAVVVRERLRPVRGRGRGRGRAVPAVAPLAALPDQAHRGAVGVASRRGATWSRRRAPCSRETGRTSPVRSRPAWASARSSAAGRAPSARRSSRSPSRREWRSCRRGSSRRCRRPGRRATSRSWSGRCCSSPPAGIVRAGRFGFAALVIVVFFWVGYAVQDNKENARAIAAGLGTLHPGELVISTHPEQVPVLRYYLGPGLRFATTLGPVRRPAGVRLGRCRLPPPSHPAAAHARPAARLGAEGAGVRRRHAGVPRLPRLAREVDEARLAEVASLDVPPAGRSEPEARAPCREQRGRAQGQLLQAVAGVRVSARRITSLERSDSR